MGYANIQADSNFYRQSLNADGVKYVTGPYTSLYEDVFRAVTVTTDSVVSVTSYVGDSLSNQFLLAGTEIYGLFSSVTIHSGKAVLHLAGASYISEIINQYSATGIPLGFYEEGTQCLSQKISALLTQGLFDDASWVMVPSQYEEDWVRAFKPTSELGNLAFTRSSDATFTDSTGVVRRSPYNLVQQSEMFSNAAWAKINSTISIDTTVAPNGTLTADKLVEDTATSEHNLRQDYNTTVTSPFTISIYAKAAERSFFQFVSTNALGLSRVNFDLTNGIVTQQGVGVTGSITSAGNGWWRCVVSATSSGTGIIRTQWNLITSANAARVESYTGNGTSGVFIWGAQLVEGTEALPYFATTDRLNVPRLDYRNADGTLSTCPRLLLEPQRTNSIRNSSMVGVVAGTPGTLPTNWVNIQTAGLSRQIVGVGTENGLPYIDLRFFGTTNTNDGIRIDLETSTSIAAATGQNWAYSLYSKLISGTIPTTSFTFFERNSGGGGVTSGNVSFALTSTLTRFSATRTLSGGATVAFVQPSLNIATLNATAYDFTIRIAAPQMELGDYATTWVPTTTTAVTRIGDAFTRNNIYTNGFISAAGGTWIVDLSNNLSLTRDAASTSLSISTLSGDVFAGANSFEIRGAIGNRFEIAKRIGGTATNLFTTTTSNVKIAIKWNGTTADVFVNGVKQVSATAFTTTVMEFLKSFGTDVPKYINQSFLAPTPLSDAECIALTTL